ncbi:MAG TPA: hypothetical protein VFB16_01580 [Bauldia sp.]|nr:hypothetical protein [Bauldia sp.]
MKVEETRAEPRASPRWRIADNPVWAYLVFVAGFLLFFHYQVFSGFAWNYGDAIDARLVTFLMESVYQAFLRGGDPLSPPFFHDWPGTLGYTDAFLLFQIPYAPARLLGADPLLATQIAPMALPPSAMWPPARFSAASAFRCCFRPWPPASSPSPTTCSFPSATSSCLRST